MQVMAGKEPIDWTRFTADENLYGYQWTRHHPDAPNLVDVIWEANPPPIIGQFKFVCEDIAVRLLELDMVDRPPVKRKMRVIDENDRRKTITVDISRNAGLNLGLEFSLAADSDLEPFGIGTSPAFLLPGQSNPYDRPEKRWNTW
jgi:hypothetical protein